MSEEKPCRWVVRYINGKGNMTTDDKRFRRRREALAYVAEFADDNDARLIRLIPKKKPRVVARHVSELTPQPGRCSCICNEEHREVYKARCHWLGIRQQKRVRITLEELADD